LTGYPNGTNSPHQADHRIAESWFIAVLLPGSGQPPSRSSQHVNSTELIESLRTAGVIITYDPGQRFQAVGAVFWRDE
jgi:hypothetical protein